MLEVPICFTKFTNSNADLYQKYLQTLPEQWVSCTPLKFPYKINSYKSLAPFPLITSVLDYQKIIMETGEIVQL